MAVVMILLVLAMARDTCGCNVCGGDDCGGSNGDDDSSVDGERYRRL